MGKTRLRFEFAFKANVPWERLLYAMLTDERSPVKGNSAIKSLVWRHMMEQLTPAQRSTAQEWLAMVPIGDEASLGALVDKLFGDAVGTDGTPAPERSRESKRARKAQASEAQEEHFAMLRNLQF